MTAREYIEEITDPVTHEVVTLRAITETELDAMVAERFGIAREDRSTRSDGHAVFDRPPEGD